ncbi:MKRN2 opposite strand protein [Echinops telfairi]|uniref:COP9 signalosome complex subunit 9 n=1 Tax=Echinops telfairi TaxID=9371 RepID=A0ABM0ZQB8_ECHTE|nr:MKRN2 opposite strand protein [Echinops telfairi]
MYGLMDQWDKYLEDFSNSGAWLPHSGPYVDLVKAGGSTGLLMDLTANEKAMHAHADIFNDFEDLFEDDNVQ